MDVWVNPNGTRNRDFRPYISQEESGRSVYPYDPNTPFHYGLYDSAQPSCGYWTGLLGQYNSMSRNPKPMNEVQDRCNCVTSRKTPPGIVHEPLPQHVDVYHGYKCTYRHPKIL